MLDPVKPRFSLLVGFVAVCLAGLGVVLGSQGCGYPVEVNSPCDSSRPDEGCCGEDETPPCSHVCINGGCYLRDAGTDASGGGSTGPTAVCNTCLPLPPDGWSGIRAFWYGPTSSARDCTEISGVTYPLFFAYAEPVAEPGKCPECACDPPLEGQCNTLPTTIEVRSAMCGQAGEALPFGGPPTWDGSCSNDYALPAGATCNGKPCAQSIAVSALGPPVEGECVARTVEVKPPNMHGGTFAAPSWKQTAIGCGLRTCEDSSGACVLTSNVLPSSEWKFCISREGDHECPAAFLDDRKLVYEPTRTNDAVIDGRDCTACSCGPAQGGICIGNFRVFSDGACTKEIYNDPINSLGGEQCTSILPGLALGSKAITDLEYIPGACEAGISEPIGDVAPDPARAATICCVTPLE